MVVAIAQAEPLAILISGGAEFLRLLHAVHAQRRSVGVNDDAGWVNEDDAGGEVCHELLEMA